jgi:hypothetical protein
MQHDVFFPQLVMHDGNVPSLSIQSIQPTLAIARLVDVGDRRFDARGFNRCR